MKAGQFSRTAADHLWRVVVCGFVFAAGLVASRLILQAIGVSPPRMPTQAPEAIAGYYLLVGSVVLAAGVTLLSRGVRGTRLVQWLVLAAFLFIGFGVSSTIETSIFSSTHGVLLMMPVLLLPCCLLAGAETALRRRPDANRLPAPSAAAFFRGRARAQWAWRFAAGIVAFPLVYFIFGIIVSPIVTEHYARGTAGLVLPEPGLILSIQLTRSMLYLLVALPVMILWSGSRRQLVVALALAFFVFVAAYDIVLAYQVPNVLLVTHAFEVLADSFVYAWLLVALLVQNTI